MMTFKRTSWLCLLVATGMAWSLPHVGFGAPDSVPGRITQVTLYRGQGIITRVIPTEGPVGPREIVVSDLPEHVVAESLFAEGSEGIDVRAVRFRTRAVGEEPREEVRQLAEALAQASDKLEVNAKQQALLAKQTAYLDQLEGFTATTAKSDLARGVLDADALQKVTLFSFEQRQALADKAVTLAKEAKELSEQISLLQRKHGEVTSGASRTVREALLFVEKRAAGVAPVRLSYLVSQCDWQPAYTLRAEADRKEVRVECQGRIRQLTGEDWSGVQLTLSTASPALAASGPGLAPYAVNLVEGGAPEQRGPEDLTAQLDAIRERLNAALTRHGEATEPGEKARWDWDLNAAANAFQSLELLSGRDLLGTLRAGDAEAAQGPSLSFALAGPVSVASRSDQQMVQIFETRLEGRFYHVATPVLTRHVYREVELVNRGDQDLLAGPVSAYLDGRFVGRGELPTVARGQMFVASFGADPQLRARRELADKTDSVQGGNRKLDFRYRLIVENYTPQPLPVRVYDRLPYSGDATEIRVTLAEVKEPLSDDALYLRRQRPKGILRWEITAPPGAVREKAHTIEYGFSVEFDRKFQLAALSGSQEQADFDRLRQVQAAPAAAASEAPAAEPAPPPPSAPEQP